MKDFYTIVIADDEEQLRHSLIRRIPWEEIGFQVVGEAENGIEALEQVERLEPDLLLTDIRMPFMSGIELAREAREICPTMQIAFLSGHDDFSYAQQAIQYNIISYMLKPISSAELTEELHREGQSIGLTTVYRQLEKLSRQGLVHKLVTDEGACYQYCSHADKNACFLLKCEGCGAIFHMDCGHLSQLYDHLLTEHGFAINPRRTLFYGLCAKCREAQQS